MAYLQLELPSFKGRAYAPLKEGIENLHYEAKLLYNLILRDAITEAEKNPVFARLTRFVTATSNVNVKDGIVTVEVALETYDGAASATHGFTRKFVYNVRTRMLDVQDINEH